MPNRTILIRVIAAAVSMLTATPVLAQAFPITMVQFDGAAGQTIQLKDAKAVVYGADDTPMYQGNRDVILKAAASTTGDVLAWDIARQKVRISATGKPQVWLSCADLQPMSVACSTSLRISSDGALVIGGSNGKPKRGAAATPLDPGVRGRLPDCPGDPRCP